MVNENKQAVERENGIEAPGIIQYKEAVAKVFVRNREIQRLCYPYDVFVTKDLDTLKQTSAEKIFHGEKPHCSNVPRAIALTHKEDNPYFSPLVVVSSEYFAQSAPYQTSFIRSNIIQGLGDDLIEISYGVHGGYQAVLSHRDFEKNGLPRKEQKNLEMWLEKMIAVSKVLDSHELREIEDKYWNEGIVLGKGFAKMAEEQFLQRRRK